MQKLNEEEEKRFVRCFVIFKFFFVMSNDVTMGFSHLLIKFLMLLTYNFVFIFLYCLFNVSSKLKMLRSNDIPFFLLLNCLSSWSVDGLLFVNYKENGSFI